MTPAELRDLAAVMRELGVFKLTVGDVTVEMSQHAIQAGAVEALAKSASKRPATDESDGDRKKNDEDDALTFAATEGMRLT